MADATLTDLLGTDILLHYDAQDVSKMYTDTGGTTLAANGDQVRHWKPQATAALSVNLTNANGPTYRSNYASSGYAALEFDGTNDALLNTSTGLTTGQRAFLLVVETWIGAAGTCWNRGNGADWQRGFYSTTSVAIQDSGIGLFGPTTPTGCRVTAHVAGANQSQTDCLGVSAGSRSNQTPSGLSQAFTLGALNTGAISQFGNFALHEILLIGANCEWGQVLRSAKILRTKYGITDPNATPQQAGGTAKPQHPMYQQVIG